MKILFICNFNQHRSPTAELLFKDRFETKSAGLYAGNPVTAELLAWADLVVVMEDEQRLELSRRFPTMYLNRRIVSLGIADAYAFNDPALRRVLKEKLEQVLADIPPPKSI